MGGGYKGAMALYRGGIGAMGVKRVIDLGGYKGIMVWGGVIALRGGCKAALIL